jgi:hypothetical protein
MSVFTLSDVSEYFSKDERTIRRWCQLGRVPGAYQTKGGHWRIRGKDLLCLKPRIDGFARNGAGTALQKFNRRVKRGSLRAIFVAVDALLSEEHAQGLNDYDDLATAMWDAVNKPPDKEAYESIKKAAVALWTWKAFKRRGSISDVAHASGLPRTTFIRHFSQYLTKDVEYRVAASFAWLHSGQTRINSKNRKPSGWRKDDRAPRKNMMISLEQPAKNFRNVNQTTLDAYNREEPWWTPRCEFNYGEIDERCGWKET